MRQGKSDPHVDADQNIELYGEVSDLYDIVGVRMHRGCVHYLLFCLTANGYFSKTAARPWWESSQARSYRDLSDEKVFRYRECRRFTHSVVIPIISSSLGVNSTAGVVPRCQSLAKCDRRERVVLNGCSVFAALFCGEARRCSLSYIENQAVFG